MQNEDAEVSAQTDDTQPEEQTGREMTVPIPHFTRALAAAVRRQENSLGLRVDESREDPDLPSLARIFLAAPDCWAVFEQVSAQIMSELLDVESARVLGGVQSVVRQSGEWDEADGEEDLEEFEELEDAEEWEDEEEWEEPEGLE